jgi:acyl dehydratase
MFARVRIDIFKSKAGEVDLISRASKKNTGCDDEARLPPPAYIQSCALLKRERWRMNGAPAFGIFRMKEHYFDDLKVGDRFKSEPLTVTEKQLIEFAHKFDPQMFHLSRKTAERTLFKGLIASGWHTAAMTMRLFVQTLNFAEGAIGLGVDELRWPNAVRPGDVLTVETEILDLRPSRSKPGYGIIRLRNVTTNQRGEIVQTMLASAMVPRRGPGVTD